MGSPQPEAVLTTDLPGLQLLARGKVRDVYAVDDSSLLFVATDRLSAFDVVMLNVRTHEKRSDPCVPLCVPD
jgi:phosphoribosylaminoimidazole-succinocarboxamide synthase